MIFMIFLATIGSQDFGFPDYRSAKVNQPVRGSGLVSSWSHDPRGVHLVVRGDLLPDPSKEEEWHPWVDTEGRPFLRVNVDSTWSKLYFSKDHEGKTFGSTKEFETFRQNEFQAEAGQPAFLGVETSWFADQAQAGVQSSRKVSGSGPELPDAQPEAKELVRIDAEIKPLSVDLGPALVWIFGAFLVVVAIIALTIAITMAIAKRNRNL